jgi:hypothetical protein
MGHNQPPQGFGGPPGPTTFPPSTYPPPPGGFPPPQGPPGGFDPHHGPPGGFGQPQGPPGGFQPPPGPPGGGFGPQDPPGPPGAYQPPQGPPGGFEPPQGPPHGTATFPAGGFPPGPPQGGGNAAWGAPPDGEQGRFNAFQPEPADAPKADAPPKERNLRVFVLVVIAAALLVIVPLGAVWVFTRGSDAAFSPEVGSCVRQSGADGAVKAECDDPGAFKVVSKEDSPDKCADKAQPHIKLASDGGKEQVLCLEPASGG